jgi:hypothetical protein
MKITLDLPEIEGYEYTGEHRQATSGDIFLNSQNEMHVITNTSTHGHYPILKKKAPKYKTTTVDTGRELFEYVEKKALEDALELSSGMIMTDNDIAIYKELYSLLN